MKHFKTTMARCAMVAGLYLQSQVTPKAEAIATASTSSGDACGDSCIDGFYDCAGDWNASYLNGSGPGNCIGYYGYCRGPYQLFGSPFTQWGMF